MTLQTHDATADRSRLGHFRSEQGQQQYEDSYQRAMQLLPEPVETLDLATDFGTVRVYKFAPAGDQTEIPVVLLPGRTSGVPMWQQNLPDFAGVRATYALDALGDAGLSVQTKPLRDGAAQAAWIDQVLAQLPAQTFHLVGHSFGGWLAANYAVRLPDRVQTLTLLEPVFVLQGLRWQIYLKSLPASLSFLPRRWRQRMLGNFGGVGAIDLDDPVTRMISDATEHYALKLPFPARPTTAQLAGLRPPVYVALADRSVMHDAAAAAKVAEATIPRLELSRWPEASHSLPMEYPRQLDSAVLAFMAAHDQGEVPSADR